MRIRRFLALALVSVLTAFIMVVPTSLQAHAATYVANLRVVSYGPGGTGGHSFILVKNTSSSSITVGVRSVAADGTISVGTWGNKPDGKGVYYNLERYYVGQGAYSGRVSLSMNLTSAQLATVTSSIKNNNSWSLLNNCSSFASRVWNSVSGTKVGAGFVNTPTGLANSIKSKSGYVTNTSFPSTTSSNVYRQDGTAGSHQSSSSASGSSSSG